MFDIITTSFFSLLCFVKSSNVIPNIRYIEETASEPGKIVCSVVICVKNHLWRNNYYIKKIMKQNKLWFTFCRHLLRFISSNLGAKKHLLTILHNQKWSVKACRVVLFLPSDNLNQSVMEARGADDKVNVNITFFFELLL